MGNAMDYLGFVSGGLNTAAGLATSLISQSQQRKENEKNRQFNAQQAQLNRDFQSQMSDRANAWNSPAAQVNRLRSAGLNPALIYQGSSFGQPAVAPSGGQASSGSSGLPGIQAPKYEGALMQAQIDNIRADTENKRINNDYLPQILQGQIDFNGVQIRLGDAQTHLTEEEAKTIEPTIKKLVAEASEANSLSEYYAELKASVSEDIIYKQIQNYFASDKFRAEIDNLQASTGLMKAECSEILTLMVYKMMDLKASAHLKENQAHTEFQKWSLIDSMANKYDEEAATEKLRRYGINIQNQKLQYDFESDKMFSRLERAVGIARATTESYRNMAEEMFEIIDDHDSMSETSRNAYGDKTTNSSSHGKRTMKRSRGFKGLSKFSRNMPWRMM